MALIAIRNFKGEMPKLPAHLLPDGAAATTYDCDFANGHLRGLPQHVQTGHVIVDGLANRSVTSLFANDESYTTENPPRLKMYSSTAHTERVWRGPVIDDAFKRVYVIQKQYDADVNRVTNAHLIAITWDNATGNKAAPADSAPYIGQAIVGVPTPTTAPTLFTEQFVGSLPGITTPRFRLRCWWESDGVRYQETTWNDITAQGQVVTAAGNPGGAGNASHPTWATQFIINPPPKDFAVDEESGEEVEGRTPLDAVLGVELRLLDDTKSLLTLSTTTKATVPERSIALPGGVEIIVYKSNPDQTSLQYDVRLNWGVIETRAYCFTVVNEWNEESAPSPPALVSVRFIDKIKAACPLPVMRTATAINGRLYYYQKRKIGAAGINVYRTFGGSANYLKIKHGAGSTYDRAANGGTITGDTTTDRANPYPVTQNNGVWSFVYDDVHTPTDVSTGLISIEWEPPPDGDETNVLARSIGDPKGLTLMQNGWFAMYRNNTLYMSEPYRPHTWPYSMTFPSDIKAICEGAQALVVATTDSVYIVNGTHPASVSQTRLPVPLGGVSQLGICNVEGSVAVLTNDGILLVTGSQATLEFSNQLFTRDVWRTRYGVYLPTMRLIYHRGLLICSVPSWDGFAVRPGDIGSFTKLSSKILSNTIFPSTGDVLATLNTGTVDKNVYNLFTSQLTTVTDWTSKEYTFQKPESMGAFYIRCTLPTNTTMTVFINLDGVGYYSTTVTGTGYYRIPAAHLGRDGRGLRWQVRFSLPAGGSGAFVPVVSEFLMAQTMAELKSA